jgi:hypothetical protein
MDDDTAAARLTAYLDARHRWAADEGIELFDCIGYLSPPFDVQLQEGDIRAVLAENRDLAEKLSISRSKNASLRAQRDAMETALNTANAIIHRVETVCCWENEDRKWFAFRDDLYEALRGTL